jgi:hypothetical protein
MFTKRFQRIDEDGAKGVDEDATNDDLVKGGGVHRTRLWQRFPLEKTQVHLITSCGWQH